MLTRDFDYDLPESLVAKQPLPVRDASRLLHLAAQGGCIDRQIPDLSGLVRPGDVWVLNDTRVIPARLLGRKKSGGKVEILLLEPAGNEHVWRAWGKSNRPLKAGDRIRIAADFEAKVLARQGKEIRVRLSSDDVAASIDAYGHMPLPPYIDRPDTVADKKRYQTVFARHTGAVAAPTAGLHLTHALLERLEDAGARLAHITLHVGPGTFQPVQVDRIEEHVMHEESYHVPEPTADAVNAALKDGGRIVAVGTTSLRTLEAAFRAGRVQKGAGRASLFIYPGYRFQAVDALLTNFHLPRSTLLMLVCALAGRERILAAYEHAKSSGYRFYSYGDAMFVEAHSA